MPAGRKKSKQSRSGIYRIRNIVDGKKYIGSAINITARWRIHRGALIRGDHTNKYLQNAWNKYGKDNFVFEVLEYCDEDLLIEREQFYLPHDRTRQALMDGGFYNIRPHAASNKGVKASEETRKKLAAIQSSPEYKKKQSELIKAYYASKEHLTKQIEAIKAEWKKTRKGKKYLGKSRL